MVVKYFIQPLRYIFFMTKEKKIVYDEWLAEQLEIENKTDGNKIRCDWCKRYYPKESVGQVDEVTHICKECYEKEKNEDGTVPMVLLHWKE